MFVIECKDVYEIPILAKSMSTFDAIVLRVKHISPRYLLDVLDTAWKAAGLKVYDLETKRLKVNRLDTHALITFVKRHANITELTELTEDTEDSVVDYIYNPLPQLYADKRKVFTDLLSIALRKLTNTDPAILSTRKLVKNVFRAVGKAYVQAFSNYRETDLDLSWMEWFYIFSKYFYTQRLNLTTMTTDDLCILVAMFHETSISGANAIKALLNRRIIKRHYLKRYLLLAPMTCVDENFLKMRNLNTRKTRPWTLIDYLHMLEYYTYNNKLSSIIAFLRKIDDETELKLRNMCTVMSRVLDDSDIEKKLCKEILKNYLSTPSA